MSNNIVSRLKRKKIEEVLDAGTRMDGRGLLQYRELMLKTNFLEKSEGSAEVKLGKTHVVIGVKAGLGTPFDDTPDEGVLMVNAEYTPVAHSDMGAWSTTRRSHRTSKSSRQGSTFSGDPEHGRPWTSIR